MQAIAPKLTLRSLDGQSAEIRSAKFWIVLLFVVPIVIVVGLHLEVDPGMLLVGNLALFGIVFAVNSAIHSYLILAFSKHDGVSVNVGFYYMAM